MIQLLAALTGDRKAAELCNVVNTGHREDAYTGIYNIMLQQIGDTAKITREDTKSAIMTSFYSSRAEPKRVFGEGALLDVFYGTLMDVAPGCWELNETLLALWNPEAYSHDWILPDNFHVHVKVISDVRETVHFLNKPYDVFYKENLPAESGRSLGPNMIHSVDGMIVREITRRCDYDPRRINSIKWILDNDHLHGTRKSGPEDKMLLTLWKHYEWTGYLSARILDYICTDNIGLIRTSEIYDLLGSMPEKPFKVVSIHDAFRCLPHYGNDLRKQYALQLYLIAKSNLLSALISQLVGKNITVNKLDPEMYKDILATNYALS